MARIPPSNIGPKHLGGRVGHKGPGSTKTLTTNTFTTTTGVSSAIHDPSVPRTYLFDIYKNEAESHFEIGEYRLAADCYNAAIKLQPTDTAAIVARSQCYTQMGRWKRAMKDCDEALGIDPSFPEALYQKAEILYINGNYDLAHVYFKRGLRQQPDSMLFKQAVQKASDAVHKHGSSAVPTKPTKLTAVGDLSMFLHSKQRRNLQREPTRLPADDDDGSKFDLPSAGFRARFNVGPLVRINRKPGVSILRAHRPESARSDTSAASATRMPDESTMRCILGELYGDRKYLKMFQNNLPGGKAERDLTLLADEGLEFLRERTMFWDSLGPLPPPQIPRRSNMKERSFFFGSKESLNTIPSARTPREVTKNNDATELSESDGQTAGKQEGGKKKLLRRPKKKQKLEVAMGLEKDCTSINFRFNSLQESRSASRNDTDPDPSPLLTALKDRHLTRMGRSNMAGIDQRAADRKRELTRFVNKEMDSIDEAFKNGEFAECKHKAEMCLETIADLDGEEINKTEVMASLYSCMGNACIAMNDFDAALNNHLQALHIGETENIKEVINRALGHLGRMYIIQKRFNKALEVFARKAPTVVSAEEVAQVFHEIGNCFLALGHLDYARDCGKKALRAAEDADIHYFKFQSWVLIAVSESRMKHHEEAYKAFQNALELAKKKDDQESMTVILFALEHLSKTITSILKKRELLSERLTSRSKTQALIDLNKRPHAARQKKRKKRLRREATTLDGVEGGEDFLTRDNTMMDRDNTFHLTTEDTMVYSRQNQPYLPPLPQYQLDHEDHQNLEEEPPTPRTMGGGRRGSLMFEENPRELEPFPDPRLKSRQDTMATGQQPQSSPSPHKRHGILEHIERREEGANLDTSREKISSPCKVTPRTPRAPSKMDSHAVLQDGDKSKANMDRSKSRGHSRSQSRITLKMNISSPCNTGEDKEKGLSTEKQRSPSKASNQHGGPQSRDLSPRKQFGQRLSPNPKHDVSAGALSDLSDTPRDANGNAVEREYVLMTDRTGVTQSDLDVEGLDTFKGAEALANRHHDIPQYHAPERRLSRRSAEIRDASLDDQDTTLDVTFNASGGPGFSRSGLTSGQYADLSCTADESMDQYSNIGLQSHNKKDVDPATEQRQTDGQTAEITNVSPRRRRTHRSRRNHDHDETTPGRFTRESFFEEDEDELDGAGNSTLQNPDDTFDLVSVSRQHIVHPRETRPRPDLIYDKPRDAESQHQQKHETEQAHHDPTTNEVINKSKSGEPEAAATPRPVPLERQSSKVSLKGFSHEAGEVTLETTKPYRVSSAKTNRSANLSGQGEQPGTHADEIAHQSTVEERRPVRSRPDNAAFSPVKTPKSHVTTGSGWDGDVSMESALGIPEMKTTGRAKGDDLYSEGPQRPLFSRQKTKMKHKRKPDADKDNDDDDDDVNADSSLVPKPVPRKRTVKKSPNDGSGDGASGADDEDEDEDEKGDFPGIKEKGDATSLRSNRSVPADRNNFEGNSGMHDSRSLRSNRSLPVDKNNIDGKSEVDDAKSHTSNAKSIKSNSLVPTEKKNFDYDKEKLDSKSIKSNASMCLDKTNLDGKSGEAEAKSLRSNRSNLSENKHVAGITESALVQETDSKSGHLQGAIVHGSDRFAGEEKDNRSERHLDLGDRESKRSEKEEPPETNFDSKPNSNVNGDRERQNTLENDMDNITSHPDP